MNKVVIMTQSWDPAAVRQAIDLELDYNTPEHFAGAPPGTAEAIKRVGAEALARNKAREAVPVAMDAIIYLATYGDNETLRLKAATYIVDRVLGKITDVPMDANAIDDDDPLTKLVKAATAAGASQAPRAPQN